MVLFPPCLCLLFMSNFSWEDKMGPSNRASYGRDRNSLCSFIILGPNLRAETSPINPNWLSQVKGSSRRARLLKTCSVWQIMSLILLFIYFLLLLKNTWFLVKHEGNPVSYKKYSCENPEGSKSLHHVLWCSIHRVGQEVGLLNSRFGERTAPSLQIRCTPQSFLDNP